MAQVFKLRRGGVDLKLDEKGKWNVDAEGDGWMPRIAQYVEGREPDPVVETIILNASQQVGGGTQNDIAAGTILLEKEGRDGVRYIQDRTEETPVWMHDSLANETGERRALVRRMALEQLSDQHGPGNGKGSMLGVPNFKLGVVRNGLWESVAARNFPQASPSAAISVIYDYTAAGAVVPAHDVVGGAPARNATFVIEPSSDQDELGRVWIGTRSSRKHGTLANFVNIWELELGTLGTDAALAADATASPGGGGNTKVVVTPGTTGWAKRHTIKLSDVTSNFADNLGFFLNLLRFQVSAASTTWEIQFRYGYEAMADDDFVHGRIVEIGNTTWDYIEMDNRAIPIRDLRILPPSGVVSGEADGGYTVQIWGRRTSGAGNLELDAICPIPLDESWLISKDFSAIAVAEGDSDVWVFGSSPHPMYQALVYEIDSGTAALTFQETTALGIGNGATLPVGDGRMVIVYAREASSDITDTVIINSADVGFYYERWYTLRGAE